MSTQKTAEEIAQTIKQSYIEREGLYSHGARVTLLAHDFREALQQLESRARQAEQERDNWIDTANQELRNTQYYRDLIIQIGEMIGESARTCDDGSKSEDILCAKVPELVRGRFDSAKRLQELTLQNELRWMHKHTEAEQEAERLRKALDKCAELHDTCYCDDPNDVPIIDSRIRCLHCTIVSALAPQPTEAQEHAEK